MTGFPPEPEIVCVILEGVMGVPSMAMMRSPSLQADRVRRPTLEHRVDLRGRLPARRPEHDPEQKDGEQEVGRRAGPDRDHPAPRGLTPVGIRAQTVAQLLEATRQRACLDTTVCRNRLDRLELTASLVEVLGIECPLQPLGRADQFRGLANGASEVRVDIGRLWTRSRREWST